MNTNNSIRTLGNLSKVSFAQAARFFGWLSFFLLFLPALLLAQAPTVVSFTPTRNALNVAKDININVIFSQDINPSTLADTTIRINGSLSGLHPATFSYNPGTYIVTIDPNTDFKVGELVSVILTRRIKNTVGDPLVRAQVWSFTIKDEDSNPWNVRIELNAGCGERSIFSYRRRF